jgi:hypothetical protein
MFHALAPLRLIVWDPKLVTDLVVAIMLLEQEILICNVVCPKHLKLMSLTTQPPMEYLHFQTPHATSIKTSLPELDIIPFSNALDSVLTPVSNSAATDVLVREALRNAVIQLVATDSVELASQAHCVKEALETILSNTESSMTNAQLWNKLTLSELGGCSSIQLIC